MLQKDAYPLLKSVFGHAEFRDGQRGIVDALLGGRDALGIMPTGAGKSICYQLPALMLSGVTVVISPLISLMKDQVMALKQAGVAAAYINSSLTPGQIAEATRRAAAGQYRIVYVAPERLDAPDFQGFAQAARIRMVTVDEAHCVSQWGQDFRPSYLRIRDFLARLPVRPVVSAFTATATARVRGDILSMLGLRNPLVMATGFDRPNLFFWTQRPKDKYAALADFLDSRQGLSGIVYCSTRKAVEQVYDRLNGDGYSAVRYHAGLGDAERARSQDAFQYDAARIMVATNAFGMGIDKSNVSFVVHYNMPKDLESYYQEAGRAGRDGEPADCLLLYGKADVFTAQFLITHQDENPDLTPDERGLLLEQSMERLKQMTFYSTTKSCLRRFILRYFGDGAPERCGHCSVCAGLPYDVSVTRARRVRAKRPDRPVGAASGLEPSPADLQLYDALLKYRNELARRANVPAYVVLNNATLREMADQRPATPEQLRSISGIGDAKLKQYGDAFLTAIRDWRPSEASSEPPDA